MKKSFILYIDQSELVYSLTDNKAGKLLKALYKFSQGEEVKLDAVTNAAFLGIKQTLIRDFTKWDNIRERNRKNGIKGGRPKAKITQNNPNNPNGYFGNPKNLDSVSDSASEKLASNTKLEDKTLTPSSLLESVWKKVAPGIFDEHKINDPVFMTTVKSMYLTKGKAATERAVRSFIEKQKEITPPEEYYDFAKQWPKAHNIPQGLAQSSNTSLQDLAGNMAGTKVPGSERLAGETTSVQGLQGAERGNT